MLKRSKDRKVANSVTKGGNPNIANAFGLPSGKNYSCPAETDFCGSICYASNIEKIFPSARAVVVANWDALKDESLEGMVTLLDSMISEFEGDCDRKGSDKLFRIHWNGDFFNIDYTLAWATVIAQHPNTKFWVYTRVLSSAMMLKLKDLNNLALYFSADQDNMHFANVAKSKDISIAYVGKTFLDGKAAFPGATRCPENNGALPLISEKGSACKLCGLCINGRKDVLFSASKS
jgi:hypothetical protein